MAVSVEAVPGNAEAVLVEAPILEDEMAKKGNKGKGKKKKPVADDMS